MSMIDIHPLVGNLNVTMTMFTATRVASEALVRYEDGSVYVACLLADDTVRLHRATLADLERGLPLIEGQTDTEDGGEDEIAVISPVSLTLAA
jgi:hypothetical protein